MCLHGEKLRSHDGPTICDVLLNEVGSYRVNLKLMGLPDEPGTNIHTRTRSASPMSALPEGSPDTNRRLAGEVSSLSLDTGRICHLWPDGDYLLSRISCDCTLLHG